MEATLDTDYKKLQLKWAQEGRTYAAPIPAKSAAQILASGTLQPSGEYSISGVLDLEGARRLAIDLAYDAAAVGGQPSILVQVSSEESQPASGDDTWLFLGVDDGAVGDQAITAGSLPADVQDSEAPNWGRVTQRRLDLRVVAALNATDKLRQRFLLSVEHARWARVLYAEAGATANPGAVTIRTSLST